MKKIHKGQGVHISEISQKNIHAAVEILLPAFEDKFFVMLGRNKEKNMEFVSEVIYSDTNIQIFGAFGSEQLLGIMALKSQKISRNTGGIKLFSLMKKYGLWYVLRFLCVGLFLEHSVKAGELYIDFLAVGEGARGKGIGTKLLDFSEEKASELGERKLTLYVSKSNRAKRLYERSGFKLWKEDSSFLAKILLGSRSWHYMGKEI